MTDIFLLAVISLPVLMSFFLKSNAAAGFLALCAGFVVSTSAVGDLRQLLNQMDLTVTETTLALILISVPLILTLLLVRNRNSRGMILSFQLLAAACAGGLLVLSVGPVLGESLSDFNLEASTTWKILRDFQAAIIGAGALVSLLLLWLGGFKSHSKKHK